MIPEFRTLIETAQDYLRGEKHFSEVCSKSSDFLFYTKQLDAPKIRSIAEEWNLKALQVWDEWGKDQGNLKAEERISESEYKKWITNQLRVLNDEFEIPKT